MSKKNIIVWLIVVFFICNLLYFINKIYSLSFYQSSNVDKAYVLNKDNSIILEDSYFQMRNGIDTVNLANFIEKRPCLVLRIPNVSCQMCKSTELQNFNKLYLKNNDHNLLVILTGSARELQSLHIEYNYKYSKVCTYSAFNFDSIFNLYDRPFYFLLDTNFQAHSFFYPSYNETDKTFEYYDFMANFIAN